MRRGTALFVLLLVFISTAVGHAQVTTARLEGIIKDASGAIVPGVNVTATQTGTNVTFDAVSNEIGLYVFPRLTPGSYTVAAELPGFKRSVHSGIGLAVGDTATLNIALEVGAVAEIVQVTEETAVVDTVSTSLGNVINTRQIEELPLVSRNPMDLFYLQPGANRFATGGRIDGLRGTTSNVTVEGISATEPDLGSGATSTAAPVPIEAVSEYRVVTSSASAEYGRGAGAQVQVVYRSGTNDFHGSVFEFHRNRALNANSFANNRTNVQRPALVRNQFGGSIGGPIIKSKMFFYVTYEGIRQRTESTENYMVYTPTLKSGIFRYYNKGSNSVSLVDRTTGVPKVAAADISSVDLLSVDPTRLGKDPSGLFDKLLGPYSPNNYDIGDGLNIGGYQLVSLTHAPENQIVSKVDYVINPKERLAVSYAYHKTISEGTLMPNGQRRTYNGFQKFPTLIIALDSTLSPTLLNEFRIGGTQRNSWSLNADPTRFDPHGIVSFTGLGGPGRNWPANTGLEDAFTPVIYTLNDNVTWIHNVHTLRAGADIRVSRDQLHYGDDYWSAVISTTNSGNPANVPALTGLSSADRTRAQQLTNDLTGSIGNIRQSFQANAPDHYTPFEVKYVRLRAHEYGFFFQDTWKIKANLTLNLGTRYELMPPQFEAGGLFANPIGGPQGVFGISGPLGETKLGLAADKGKQTYKTDRNNFAPSIGFNWDPDKAGKWSVSANYRITYDRHYLTNTLFQIVGQEGTTTDQTYNAPSGTRLTQLSTLFNSRTGYFDPGVPFGPKPFNRNGLVTAYDPTYYTPYTGNWSLKIQREVVKNTLLSVSYVGNKATGLMRSVDINQIEIRKNGFLEGFLAAQRNLTANGDPTRGESTGVFGRLYAVMTAADQAGIRTDLAQGNVATVADFIDRTRVASNYLGQAGLPQNFFRLNPQFQTAWIQGNNSNSTYHAMKVSVTRRFQDGLQFDANYTFSKNLTDSEGSQSNRIAYRDNDSRGLDKTYAGIDATHVWNANFNWELPVGNGRHWMNTSRGVLDSILGGWQMNGIFAYSSGMPFTMTSGRNKLNTGNTSTADCTGCDPNMTSKVIKGDVIAYLTDAEKAKFTDPAAGSAGGTAMRYFRGPNNWLLDGSIFKSFRLREDQRQLQTRFEFFNVFNHTNFSMPGSGSSTNNNLTSGTFGTLSPPTTGQRIIQVALKLLF